jgi:hypothetical protein
VSAQELATKYIAVMEETLKSSRKIKTPIAVSEACVDEVFGYLNAYLNDAKYFLGQGKFETSLVSIAYCEGLFDALKLISAVRVLPPNNQQ